MSQEQIFLYFKTAEFLKNKFVLDLLPTEVFHRKRLLYNFNELQLNNSRDYEHVSDEIKQLSKKVIYCQKKGPFFFFKLMKKIQILNFIILVN